MPSSSAHPSLFANSVESEFRLSKSGISSSEFDDIIESSKNPRPSGIKIDAASERRKTKETSEEAHQKLIARMMFETEFGGGNYEYT